ncbi:sensor histidine kinase [Mucilaginibacter daejeonensis]|uniref:sensor histidine kinase n=1 Tax=Mucilaginibacter daejeonensis TaxID=398049 RepID=UPI001D175D94|nr:sensor histidine kinase [Mucilaginibacter daejeonensis]UEG52118.1 sensor histidine kinase [Mucilaginibacter daejeonensis]
MLVAVYFVRPFDKLINIGEQVHAPGGPHGPPPGMPSGYEMHMPPPPPSDDDSFGGRAFSHHDVGMPPPMRGGQHLDITSLFIYVMLIALGMSVSSVQQWLITERRVIQIEADKTSAELSFLKAQINPHFLFNTLNNIYTLAVTGNIHTATSIMKLSNLMRYLTDEVSADRVPLQKEVDSIYDYLDLQRLRIGTKTNIDLSVTGDLSGHEVPPLILMSFIENIFKYGISKRDPSTVRIDIKTEPHQLSFFCQNRIFTGNTTIERVGIGIANSRQRLQYLYGEKHHLAINSENGLFTVYLTLLV